jgi:Undecaprenyl-phosphate glucose phosphotransferase
MSSRLIVDNVVDAFPALSASGAASDRSRQERRKKRPRPISLSIVPGIMVALDAVAILASGLLAWFVSPHGADSSQRGFVLLAVCLSALCAINLQRLLKAYRIDNDLRMGTAFGKMLLSWLAAFGLVTLFAAMSGPIDKTLNNWLEWWGISGSAVLIATRFGIYSLTAHWRATDSFRQSYALVGTGPIARRLLQRLDGETWPAANILGVFQSQEDRRGPARCMGRPVRSLDSLVEEVRQGRIDAVVLAIPVSEQWQIGEVLRRFEDLPVDVWLCPDEIGFRLAACDVTRFAGVPLLNLSERPLSDWRWIAKAVEDRLVAALLIVLLFPVLLLIACLIKLDSSGPIFFHQRRYGFNNELIEILKFRTMYHHERDANCEQQTRRNDPRVTAVGRLLRRTSLDELPQLFNVLFGEMSIVGPRPHATATKADGILFEDATKHYWARHRVKPGITGWAQINGWRGETHTIGDIQNRLEHDLYYIAHWSLIFDFIIILRTMWCGFIARKAY